MACHEIAALRVGMMTVLGVSDPAELKHELAELGDAANAPGPLNALTKARSLAELRQNFGEALGLLEEKTAALGANDPKLAYYRTLLVLTKKVEQDLRTQEQVLTNLYQDLEEVHDYVHEIYPAD